jgi:hypothetical protein
MSESDRGPYLAAFLDAFAPEVFHSVEHRHEIWKQDLFDVESLHTQARAAFARLLNRATTPPGLDAGRILLLLGESGCGKTHLVRAFRNAAHENGRGYVGYMQMTTQTDRYPHYVLSNLIDSLDQPYYETTRPGVTGLMRISRALAGRVISRAELERLREPEDLTQEEADALVHAAADRLIARPEYERVDLDLVRALLYLQRDDPRVKHRVLKFVRCESLIDADRRWIGGLSPRTADDDPGRMVEAFGRLLWALDHAALVLCLDQLEEMFSFDEKDVRFRRAIATVCDLADRVPSCLIVVSCLSDFWTALKPLLSGSHVDRLEQDPEPIRLASTLTVDQVSEVIARRLAVLYDAAGLDCAPAPPTFPFAESFVRAVAVKRTRDILDDCRRSRQRSIAEGRFVSLIGEEPLAPIEQPLVSLEQAWNDFRADLAEERPHDDESITALFAWAVEHAGEELETGHHFAVAAADERLDIDVERNGWPVARLCAQLCNRATKGGHLRKQLEQLRHASGSRIAVILRSTSFPENPLTDTVRLLGEMIADGARRAVLEDSELLTMLALRRFRERERAHPQLSEWLQQANPLTQLRALRLALDLDHLEPTRGAASPRPVAPSPSSPAQTDPTRKSDANAIVLGETEGLPAQIVTLAPADLTRHAAFVGDAGSGMTTLALSIVEQLLLRRIPAVLIDRKGDLCDVVRVATAPATAATAPRLRELCQRVRARLYTPGHPEGRPLAISLLPAGIAELADDERDGEAQLAAQALAGMLGYGDKGSGLKARSVLISALQVLARADTTFDLDQLVAFVDEPDPALMAATGRLEPKLLKKVAQDLQALKLVTSRLFDGRGETLEIGRLLRSDDERTPLTVISTKFLGDNARVQFWVTQFLLQVARFCGRNPAPELQALLLFDEADLYLPATSQPATKGPLENLLRRARSSGLGVLLAAESAGELDYRYRDNIMSWLVGAIAEPVSIRKLQPLLAEARVDIAAQLLSGKAGEFFLLRKGEVTGFRAHKPVLMAQPLSDQEILNLSRSSASQSL